MDLNLEVQRKVLENWLGNYHSDANPWTLSDVKNIGRGLIATRDIDVNELILCEPPLIIGPVGNNTDDIICVICFKLISNVDVCSNCLLPMCLICSETAGHEECAFLQSLNLNGDDSSLQMVRSLTAIRGLFLTESKKNVLNLLQCNRTDETEKRIDDLLKRDNGRNNDLRNELITTASVLNTNAFQISANLSSNHNLNLRGLYPLMSLINHSCTANARYCTDCNYITSLCARKPIKMGEEISISYAKILWSTPSRQGYLKLTKQFTCKCDRCLDPTEASTFLSALKCFDRTCSGLVLPIDPMNFVSSWKCQTCSRLSEFSAVLRFQEVLSCMVDGIRDIKSIQKIDEFINNRLLKVLPTSNQYVVEMKMKIISTKVQGNFPNSLNWAF